MEKIQDGMFWNDGMIYYTEKSDILLTTVGYYVPGRHYSVKIYFVYDVSTSAYSRMTT